MFSVPQWVTLVVATLVTVFGLYRLYISWTSKSEDLKAKKGLYGLPKRTHGLFGLLYIILGGFLFASAFGYNPFREAEPTPESKWIEIPQSASESAAEPAAKPDAPE